MFKLVSLRASGFKRLDIQDKLEFPDGRLLIHGRNESGKSTLMESIHYALYGMPLRPSKNAGNEDIICYGREEAIVELEFSIDATDYQVRRELKRNKPNIHLLNKREPDGSLSRVTTGARNVNNEINEILHGIDSDALLNSCLVEQKELGKLEAANKQERIKAMSSLLNLEAFVDARDKLKKEYSDLEKIHLQTLIKLNEAEKAKEEYEKAEDKRESAEKRLAEIEQEKKKVWETLENLRKDLEIIQQMKTLVTKIKESNTKRSGKEDEFKLLKERIEEIEKAEKELQVIEEMLPEAEKTLAKLEKQLETIQHLSEFENTLRGTESKLENTKVRTSENQRRYDEAAEAKERIQRLDDKIRHHTPVKTAIKNIEVISTLFNRLIGSINETNRLETELETLRERLGNSKESEDRIKQLEANEAKTGDEREKVQNMKTGGIVGITVGLLLLAYTLLSSIWIVAVLGAVILASGGYLYTTYNPSKIEDKINQIRAQREEMLGERARLQDYHENIDRLEAEIREGKEAQSSTQEAIIQALNQLPEEPREYKAVVTLTEPETINKLRIQIQEDIEILTRYTAEKESLQKKANSLESVKETLESIQREKGAQKSEVETLRSKIKDKEQDTGISKDDEDTIRKQFTEANKTLTKLNTKKTENQRTLERRLQIQENITEAGNEINLLIATIQQEEKKLRKLEKNGINLGDEISLKEERDFNLRKSASLEKEEQERDYNIEESNQIIEKTGKLREEYPTLVEETEREEFRIEAMRRATILLDTTRESIMSGVKQNVEKNMIQFLPTLTDNRYNMARIDETNYRIEVYDREAKRWRRKGVFSGATQDQFSLALRLAFAISTIPSSRGARPGFIFLDEPLSGFDAQRRTSFMQLLREDLSKHFDQIIVISHLEALAEEFQNSLTLDSGRISEVQR
jgi:exonuclease SbcC